MTRPASRSSASRPETRSITEGVGLPAPSFFWRAAKAKPEIFVPIGEYDQVLYVRECWLVTGSEKRTETMLDSRYRPFGPIAWIVRCLMSHASQHVSTALD